MSRLFGELRNWFRPTDSGEDITLAPAAPDHLGSASPRAFVVDDEDGICQLIMMTLATMGVEAKKFHSAADAVAALDRRAAGDHLPRCRAGEVRRDRRHPRSRRARLWRHRAADERQQCRAAGGRAAHRRASRAEHAAAADQAVPRRGDPSRRHQRASRREPAHRRRARRGARQGLARAVVSAEDRPAQQRARRRRGADPLPPSGPRHPVAGELPAGRERKQPCGADRARDHRPRCATGTTSPKTGVHAARRGQHLDRRARQPAASRPDPRASLAAAPTGPA